MESINRRLILVWGIQFLTSIHLSSGWSKVLNKGIASIPDGLNEGISELTIEYTNITNLTGDSLMNLTNLYSLKIQKNKLLENIDTSIFQGLVSLKYLTIADNSNLISIDKLHADALSNLEALAIVNNPLTSLSMELVQGADKLDYFRVKNDKVTSPPLIKNLLKLRTLDLASNRIATIPRGYFFGLKIQSLSLEYNILTAIPDLASVSQTLVVLNLHYNYKIAHFEDGIFSNFPVLSKLYMWSTWHFKISELATATDGLPSLKVLNLGATSVSQVNIDNEALKRIPMLEQINLNYNSIVTFPNFYLNKAIKKIYMRHTWITHFTGDELRGLDNLELLEVLGNLVKFPNLVHARKLITLRLFYNSNMGNVPLSALAAVPDLKKLELTDTNLTEFPCIACLRHTLTTLYLNENSLTVIPVSRLYDDILCLCNNKEVTDRTNIIKTLYLSHNPGIQQVNRTFMILFTKLAKFYIKNTGLTELPYVAHLGRSLKKLDAAENLIKYIPEDYFSNMRDLEELYLSNNKINAFPVFANKMRITYLGLDYNDITQVVTKDIINLPYLRDLSLAGNKIKVFEFFYRSSYLRYVDLSYNQLPMLLNGSVPNKQWYLLNMYLNGNPLLCTKEAICWLKSENLKSTRNAVVHLSSKPCHRPARFIGQKWSSIKKAVACAENNVLADEYICPENFGTIGSCASFNATYNICEPPCCRQSEYGGECISRIATMYVKVSTASCCSTFVEKSVRIAHVGDWGRYTTQTSSHCAKYCYYTQQCQAFIFTLHGQDCTLLYESKLAYDMPP